MRRILLASVLLVFGVVSFAQAKIPPLSEQELTTEADLIAEVVVLDQKMSGNQYADHCYSWQDWEARLQVVKVYKGKPVKEISVHFPSRVADLNDCDGGRTSYNLTDGQTYKLFLSGKDGKAPYHFLNWSGVQKVTRDKKRTETPKP